MHWNKKQRNDNDKKSFNNLTTTIYFTNHEKGQLADFLKKYLCIIYVKNGMEWSVEAFTMTHDLWQIPVNLKTW